MEATVPTEIVALSATKVSPVMSMAEATERYNAVVEFTKTIMKSGIDYGIIPGTDKPTLLKPGAERLCSFFGFSVDYELTEHTVDWLNGLFFYSYKAILTRGGALVATGIGSCNSFEKKYRWRWVGEADVPAHLEKDKLASRDGSVREPAFAIDKAETTGKYGKPAEYWQRFKDAIASKTARPVKMPKKGGDTMAAWEISGKLYRIPNEDAADALNTIQKMAQKRALIAAVLVAANASEFYTQDLEDLEIIDVEFTEVPQVAVGRGQDVAASPKSQPSKSDARIPFEKRLCDALEARGFGESLAFATKEIDALSVRKNKVTTDKLSAQSQENLLNLINDGFFDSLKERFVKQKEFANV